MSREKECKCCHEWWYASVIKEDLCPNCYDYFKQLKQQLAEKDKEIAHLKEKDNYHLRYELAGADETITNLKEQLAEKDTRIAELEDKDWYEACIKQLEEQNNRLIDTLKEKEKEIESLKEWQDWYSMWHKKFQKQIEDLTTELETYRPTKLHGNGQCKCFNCNAINWTDWCSKYKGHIYCDDCLKEVLKEEQTSQTQLALQELEKVKTLIQNAINFEKPNFVEVYDAINKQIKELKGE